MNSHRESVINGANVSLLEAFVRDNKHFRDAFIYGYHRDKDIPTEIMFTIVPFVETILLSFLKPVGFYNSLDAKISIELIKYLSGTLHSLVVTNIDVSLIKLLQKEIKNLLTIKLSVSIQKLLETKNIENGIRVGTVRIATSTNEVNEFENIEIRHGLRVGIVRPRRISDIENLTIAQIQNRTIEDICFVAIN